MDHPAFRLHSPPSTIVELWRMWTWLEEELLALPITAGPGCKLRAEMTEDEFAAADRRHGDLCSEIEALRALAQRIEVRTIDDVAALVDMVLEYDAEPQHHADDRRVLQHLIDALARLAPAVKVGAISRSRER